MQAENKQGKLHIRPSIYWNRSMDRFELFRGAPQKYAYNYHRTDVCGVNLNAYFDWYFGRTAFGVELRNENIVSTNLGEKLDNPRHIYGTDRDYTNGINRTNLQFVLEHNIILSRFTLSAGVVAVKNSQANMNMRVYPGLDASYRIGNAWKFYASYNTSLRMPSFTELFYSVGGHKADKHLKPEELSALEAGVKYNTRGIIGKASFFYHNQKNLIDWISDGTLDANGSTLWKSVNFGRINLLGAETSLNFDFYTLIPSQHFLKQFGIAYCYLNQNEQEHNGITSKYVLEYVKNKMVANLQLNLWRNLELGLNYRLLHRMGSYVDINNQRHKYATYGILDSRLSWNESKWTAFVAANNLLNRTYVDYGNVTQPGTWITAGISIQM